ALVLGAAGIIFLLISRRFATKYEAAEETAGLKGKVLRIWTKVHDALDEYSRPRTRGALAMAFVMSLVFQSSMIALNLLLAVAVGLALPIEVLLWLIPALSLASMLPLGIGGLGVREAAALALLNDAPPELFQAAPGYIIAWSLLA